MAEVLGRTPWLAPLVALLAGCSLIEGSLPSWQCQSDADCQREPALRSLSCDLQYGVCVAKELARPAAADACDTSELCTEQLGRPSLCRVRGEACIALTTPECSHVEGAWPARDSLLIGVIGSDTFSTYYGNEVTIPGALPARRAIDLGLKEWHEQLPSGVTASGSSLAVVHCNAMQDADRAEIVFDHLAGVGVKAVIALTDVEREAIVASALARRIPVLCAACTERAPRAARASVESWRMDPPLDDQAPLAAQRARDIEQQIRTERGLPADVAIRIALVGQDSPAYEPFVGAVRALLRFNGELTVGGQREGSFLERTLPDPRREIIDAVYISDEFADFQPDVLIAGMDSDVASVYLPMVEQQWDAERPRPFYILTAQNRDPSLLDGLARSSADLHLRVSGTAPLASEQVARNRAAFATRFMRDYDEPPGETQNAYDALYATAYAFYAADLLQQYVGDKFVDGLVRLTSGPRVDADPGALLVGLNYLLEGGTIDLVGSSSELDWDLSSGGVTADTTLWCLTRDATGGLVVHDDTGRRWRRATGMVEGTYACPP
jgi:hypothetical protein